MRRKNHVYKQQPVNLRRKLMIGKRILKDILSNQEHKPIYNCGKISCPILTGLRKIREKRYLKGIDMYLDYRGVDNYDKMAEEKPLDLLEEEEIARELWQSEHELEEDYRPSLDEILHRRGMHIVDINEEQTSPGDVLLFPYS